MEKIKEFFRRKFLRWMILRHFREQSGLEQNPEISEVIGYLRRHRVHVFPYEFRSRYKARDVEVSLDPVNGLLYTKYQGKKMYYKNGRDGKKARKYFNSVMLEQDPQSPHRYLTDTFNVEPGEVVADVGVAEGIFALSVVEDAGRLYLFEPDHEWHKALKATFKPWEEKVEIITKMVSNTDNADRVSLDGFFHQKGTPDFIKIDVDGLEEEVLRGAKNIIEKNTGLKMAVCTYHFQKDAEQFEKLFREAGFETHFSKGYMIYRVAIEKPYLRKAVLRARSRQ